MRALIASLVLAVLATGSGCGGGGAGDDDGGPGGDGGLGGGDGSLGGDAAPPPPPDPTCPSPVELADVSSPRVVVGDGSAGSCTEAALRDALAGGGVITFACGAAPVSIPITATLHVGDDTVLDGGGLVTLDGGGAVRILELDTAWDQVGPALTVQRITFAHGASPDTGADDTEVGGGAIWRVGGTLTVIEATFDDNHAPSPGQDIAGGAIYGAGGGPMTIVSSVFVRNEASSGGAVGSLQTELTIVNSLFEGNTASGHGGNPGNGGNGGAIYLDGVQHPTTICGTTIKDNRAGAIGGGLFRVSNTTDGTFLMDRSTVIGNRVADGDPSNAGGMYLQGLDITITASTIASNSAEFNGGLWIGQDCHAELTNVTIADNEARTSHGGGVWLAGDPTGFFRHCTFADNRSTGSDGFAAGIFATGMSVESSIFVGQSAGNPYPPITCNESHPGGGNLQWPVAHEVGGSDDPDALCTADTLVADAMVGALGDNGGPTPTVVPQAGSPAIGHVTEGCPATDQRGQPRGTPCAAGAVEP